jgi:PPP family 3-phenylpropionic acid transporter
MRTTSTLGHRDFSGATLRLAAFYAAIFLVAGIQMPFWPVWLAGRGLAADEIGILLGASIWAKVIATPAIGALADRLGRRRAVMVGLAAVSLIAYALLWRQSGFWPLLLFNLVAAVAQSALMPLGDTITLSLVRGQGLDYGRIRVWGSLSFILAALGSGAVLAAGGDAQVLPLVLAAAALLLGVCLALPAGRLSPGGVSSGQGDGRPPLRRTAFGEIARAPWFRRFALAAATLQASHQVYYGFGTLHWRSLGYSDTAIGWFWAEGVLAEIVLFWFGRRLVGRLGPLGLMALGGGAGILRWGLAGLSPGLPAIAALQLLHALTFGASHLGAMHYLSRAAPPAAAATAQTLYAAVSGGFGSGLVMLAAGALYRDLGGLAYLAMALLSALGLAATVRLRRVPVPAGEASA